MRVSLFCLACIWALGNTAKAQTTTEIPAPQSGAQEKQEPASPSEESGAGEQVEKEVDDALEELKELASALGGIVRERRAEFVDQWRKREVSMQERIDEMRKEGEQLGENARERWISQMDTIEAKQKAFEAQLDELSTHVGAGWMKLRRELQSTWSELSEAVDEASAEIREGKAEAAKEAPSRGAETDPLP